MSGEIFGTEKAFFLSGDEKEENRALEFFGMRFEACGNVHDESAAETIVHGAVVDTVAVDRRADANVIDVRGKDDEFVLEGGIGAGEFGDDVGGFQSRSLNDGVGFERNGQGQVRKRLAVFAEGSDFGKGVAGACEKLFSGSGGEGDADL